MKLIVDFDEKTISLDSEENLGKFFDKINQMFPENTWKEFTLVTNAVWYSYPTITYSYHLNSVTLPSYPKWNPLWVSSEGTATMNNTVTLTGQCVIETD